MRIMTLPEKARAACTCLLLSLLCVIPAAADDNYGDTPYVPTPQNVVDRMLDLAKVGPKDYVIDLGSGDGRMILTAVRSRGAQGFGVDLNEKLVRQSNTTAARLGVANRARFFVRDLYQTDLTQATVLTIYLLPEVNLMVRPKLLSTLRPGTRIVSHDYDMGEWTPDVSFTMDAPGKTVGRDPKSHVFYWVVPAKAAGRWRWSLTVDGKKRDFELVINQNFQKVDGTLSMDGRSARLQDARLNGDTLTFVVTYDGEGGAQRFEFSGRIFNHAYDGEAQLTLGGKSQKLAVSAARTELWEPEHIKSPISALLKR